MAQVYRVPGTARPAAENGLLDELRARTPAAWAEVYNTYNGQLYRYAMTRVRSPQEADDVVATVFIRALAGIDGYRDRGRPLVAWLYGITQNVIREKQRESTRTLAKAGFTLPWTSARETPDLESRDLEIPERLDLYAAIDKLTSEQREVISLVHFGGFRVKEVAAMLGKSERAVYYLEARALLRLREDLGEDGMGGCP